MLLIFIFMFAHILKIVRIPMLTTNTYTATDTLALTCMCSYVYTCYLHMYYFLCLNAKFDCSIYMLIHGEFMCSLSVYFHVNMYACL